MKNITKWASMMVVVTLLFAGSAQANVNNNYYPPSRDITYQEFYNDLSPYGNWINDPQYGYVWSPYESDFQPYRSNGNWAYTRYGWTWVSNYRWGWAPFHYGRWTMDPYYGWLWIPGYDWAPAWVDWRSGGDYYGWAPMGPGYGFNVSVNIWNFVPRRYIYSRRLHNYYVNSSRNVIIINNTTIINNNNNITVNNGNNAPRRTYNTGPSVREVETVTRAKVRTLDVVQSSRPGAASIGTKSISMYKPEVEKIDNKNLEARPLKAIELNDVQRKEVLAVRKGTIEKGDLKPTLENKPIGVTRNLDRVNKTQIETPKRENSNSFQDNGIRNSSIDRRQLNTVKPEINNNGQVQKINATPERSSTSQSLTPVTIDRPVRNSQLERQEVPVQDKGLSPVRQIPSSGTETISREMPRTREIPQTRDVPQAREVPQERQAALSRQPVKTREDRVRRIAPEREAPVRQERVRNIPSKESNSGKSADSPRRVRRGE